MLRVMDKLLVDLDLIVKYVKLQEYYLALWEDHKKLEHRMQVLTKIVEDLEEDRWRIQKIMEDKDGKII